jgi:hypothetical protein
VIASKFPGKIDEESLKFLMEAFKADKEFIQKDYQRYIYAGVTTDFF